MNSMNNILRTDTGLADVSLVATDLDGTLLDVNGIVHEKNVAAWKLAQENGIIVVPATGRTPYSASLAFKDEFGILNKEHMGPGVYANGALVLDQDGNELGSSVWTEEEKRLFLEFCENNNWMYNILCYTKHGIYCLEKNQNTYYSHTYCGEPNPMVVKSFVGNAVKFVYKGNPEEIKQWHKLAQEQLPFLTVYSPIPWALEFVKLGISKGAGLKLLCNHFNIDLSHVMAIGDGDNDIPMLKQVGHPVAVENATAEVKQVARYTTGKGDEGGFAQMINRMLAIKEPRIARDVHG